MKDYKLSLVIPCFNEEDNVIPFFETCEEILKKELLYVNDLYKNNKVKITPLGGLHEIGKNLTVFEYENDILILDCGLAFPDEDMPGVDMVIPDITYLEKHKNRIRGIVLTHGHEDHIGAIPYVLKQFNVPIYGTKLTLGILKYKLQEHGIFLLELLL